MTSRAGRGSSESLVPQGLPHGERQALVQGRRAAGLATTNRDVQARAGAVRALGRTPLARQSQPAREGFDALLETDPTRLGPMFAERNAAIAEVANRTLDQRLADTAEASNNNFMRGVVQRMRVLRSGR